jgi:hypothetical protein
MYTIVNALNIETNRKRITDIRDKTASGVFFESDQVANGKVVEKLKNPIAAGNPDATIRNMRGSLRLAPLTLPAFHVLTTEPRISNPKRRHATSVPHGNPCVTEITISK